MVRGTTAIPLVGISLSSSATVSLVAVGHIDGRRSSGKSLSTSGLRIVTSAPQSITAFNVLSCMLTGTLMDTARTERKHKNLVLDWLKTDSGMWLVDDSKSMDIFSNDPAGSVATIDTTGSGEELLFIIGVIKAEPWPTGSATSSLKYSS